MIDLNLTNKTSHELFTEDKSSLLKNPNLVFLVILLFSRLISETVNSYLWDKANQVWSAGMLAAICFVFFPMLVISTRRKKNIFYIYMPIFAFLSYLLLRIDIGSFYSIKCYFSEFINWFAFIFAAEACMRQYRTEKYLQKAIIITTKIVVLICFGQLLLYVIATKQLNAMAIMEARPVKGIYIHQSICLIMLFPFSYYFLKKKSYGWFFAILFAAFFTGSRSAFLGFLIIFLLVYKNIFRKPIKNFDMVLTISFIIFVYSFLIYQNSSGWSLENVDSRFSMGTLQWRVDFWKKFLTDVNGINLLIGHGIGHADLLFGQQYFEGAFPPHNDYLRIYYDSGIFGLILYGVLIFSIYKKLMQSVKIENDYILLSYTTVLIFSITDNFIYHTNTILFFLFLASHIKNHSDNFSKEPES